MNTLRMLYAFSIGVLIFESIILLQLNHPIGFIGLTMSTVVALGYVIDLVTGQEEA